MPTLQEILDIAMRHTTALADAMVVACFQRAHELGLRLVARPRSGRARLAGARPAEDVDWERMVEGNGDTRWNHV
jgi:hypothetical protein